MISSRKIDSLQFWIFMPFRKDILLYSFASQTHELEFWGTSRRAAKLKICKKVGLGIKPRGNLEKLNIWLSASIQANSTGISTSS